MKRMRNLTNGTLIRTYSTTLAAMFALFLGVIFGPAPASAQQTNSSTDVPVHMVVTVKSHHGTQPPAVAADDVKVYQKGKLDPAAGRSRRTSALHFNRRHFQIHPRLAVQQH